MSFTVTATESGSTQSGVSMALLVFTGAAVSQPGTTGGATGTTANLMINPTGNGSYIIGAILGGNATFTAESGTTYLQNNTNAGLHWIQFRDAGGTTAGNTETVGSTSTANGISVVAAEILASGTLAIDSSTPAATAYANALSNTTASFTPPAGALLALLVCSNGAGGVVSISVSDTSGLGLTWTEQEKQNGAGHGYTGVWTAQMPVSATVGAAGAAGIIASSKTSNSSFAGPVAADGIAVLPPPPSPTPWAFPVTNYGAQGNGQMVTDGVMSSSSNPTHLACTTSTPFQSGDVGKAIMVKGAAATGVSTLVTTIASVTDSGHVVLSAACSTTVSGAIVVWATDDTTAFQDAVNAAVSYAQAHSYYAEVLIPPSPGLFYGIAGTLSHANSGNAQITLPVCSTSADTVTLVFKGSENGSAIRHWLQTVPQTGGSCLVSFGVYPSATSGMGNQATDIQTYGQSAMIGGPTGPNGYGTGAQVFSNMLVMLKGLSLVTTHSTYGLTYGAAWLWGCIQADIRDVGYGTTGVYDNGSGDLTSGTSLGTGESIGIGMPATANQNNMVIENLQCGGGYTYGLFATEHTDIQGASIFYCWAGLCPVGGWNDGSGSAATATHKVKFTNVGIEGCTHALYLVGLGSPANFVEGCIDAESGLVIADNNSGSALAQAQGVIHWSGTSGGSLTTANGTTLEIVDQRSANGPGTAWSLTVGTAFQNPQWRWATVVLYGGTGLTTVSLGELRGGSAAPTMATFYSQAAAALPPVTVRVPPGGWLEVSGAGGTSPTANVSYD